MEHSNIQVEGKSSVITSKHYQDDIDLIELVSEVWSKKWTVVFFTLLFSCASVYYAISLPNLYKSEALLIPAEQQGNGLGGMASQLGGLASLAGVNLGSGKADKTELALEIIKSRAFIFKFIEKYELTAALLAAKKWNATTNELIYDQDIYIPDTDEWIREVKAPLSPKPSPQESYKAFKNVFYVNKDKLTSMVTISVEHVSPVVAQQWVIWLIDSINEEMKQRDLKEANDSIVYLKKELKHTRLTDLQSVLYQLIEEQTKTVMFANVRKQYALQTIDPPLIPEMKSAPKRALIVVLGVFVGAILGTLIVLISHLLRKKANSQY